MANTIITKDGVPTLVVKDPSSLYDFELIDVRRPDEWNGELAHIKGAKLVTLGPDLAQFLNEDGDKNRKILFICRSGGRSGTATEQAMALGYKNVFNMDGGMIYWNKQSFPIERD